MQSEIIRLVLDFREYQEIPENPLEFSKFWNAFEKILYNQKLPGGKAFTVKHPQKGVIGVKVLHPLAEINVTADTRFEVVSLLEDPRASGHCVCCKSFGVIKHALYECSACKEIDALGGCCEDHVVILEGGLLEDGLVRSSCRQHIPACKECGHTASFWCHGPNCRGKVAWCAEHHRSHRQQPGIGYCPSCYEIIFPQCSVPGCNEPGTNRCEHIDPNTEEVCGIRLCNRHIARWQIFGPTKIGLGRCSQHRSIKTLSDFGVAWQIVAGTANRHLVDRENRSIYRLPTLGSFAHVLRNSRGCSYDYPAAKKLFEEVDQTITGSSTLSKAMKDVIGNASKRWPEELKRRQENWSTGLPYLENLKRELVRVGLANLSYVVTHTAFIPPRVDPSTNELKPGTLFIRVPEELKSYISNPYGRPRKSFQEATGCRLMFEKKEKDA